MLTPVPGYTHMKVFVPEARAPHRIGSSTGDVGDSTDAGAPTRHAQRPGAATLSPLVRIALDTAFGIRGLHALQDRAFTQGVRAHVSAKRRGGAPTGTVRVLTCHARGNDEFHGTALSNGRRYAWVARIQDGRLVSFRVL